MASISIQELRDMARSRPECVPWPVAMICGIILRYPLRSMTSNLIVLSIQRIVIV